MTQAVDEVVARKKIYRSSEEWAMRDLIVPKLRARWPDARIIHELPLRYSTNRIDLAAVTPQEIISVEIKSSRDVVDRLEAQLRAFLPVSARIIVALATCRTECREVIRRVGGATETWTVDSEAGTVEIADSAYRDSKPWLVQMLDMLHVAELVNIAQRHRVWQGKRPVHLELRNACADLMTGREITSAVCNALRTRAAFAVESDPPITDEK